MVEIELFKQSGCYGLAVRLPYIVITCARIDSIKRVCSEPPCCPGAFLDLLSIHDSGFFQFFAKRKTKQNT